MASNSPAKQGGCECLDFFLCLVTGMEVTHCTSMRRINDCWLTSDLLFQLSLHLTLLRGSSGVELAEDTATDERNPTNWNNPAQGGATAMATVERMFVLRSFAPQLILNVSLYSLEYSGTTAKWMSEERRAKPSLNHWVWRALVISWLPHNFSDTHTSTCKLSWTLSFSLWSKALFSSSTSRRTEALHSWTRKSATSFSKSKWCNTYIRAYNTDTHTQTQTHNQTDYCRLRDKK